MLRRMLTDELWPKLKEILHQHRIYDKPSLRETVEGILYRMRVGCPWPDLPDEFGCWNTIFQQFNRWSSQNKLMKICNYSLCQRYVPRFMRGIHLEILSIIPGCREQVAARRGGE